MGIVEDMDKKREYLRQMRKDQAGINPKLSLWSDLEARCVKVEEELSEMGAIRTATNEKNSLS